MPRLRPSIRKLGTKNIRELVFTILESYLEDKSKDSNIIRRFGLSKASFSRFAGRDWQKSCNVPDLWRNLAKVMLRDIQFIEAAARLGIKDMLHTILNTDEVSNNVR